MAVCLLLMTYPNDGRKLQRLITALLRQKLAVCIQRINYVKSYYLRENKIKRDEEKLVLIKTTDSKKEKLTDFIKKNHPYQISELIWLKPDAVDDAYATWVEKEMG